MWIIVSDTLASIISFHVNPAVFPSCPTPPQLDKLSAWYREGYGAKESVVPILGSSDMMGILSWPRKKNNIIRWIKKRNFYWRWCMRERFDKHIPPEGEILDFGCGEGYMMNYLNKNRRRHMMGVEPSMAASAQAKLLGFDVQGGIESFPPENMNFFDAIVLFQVLEHLMDPKKFLREFSRLLVPDGKLIICCPNVNSQLRNTFKNSWINWHMPFHLWHFSPETLVSFMESEGWAVSHVETVTPPVWMFQTLTVEFLDYGFTSAREGFATMREKRNGQDPMSGDCIYLVASKADKSVSD